MDVRCDRCQTEYELEDESVAEGGASVQCTSCGHTFVVNKRPVPSATPTPVVAVDAGGGASWMLTTEEGKTHRFRDPTTLQKWIVERRVGRKDRVCPPGGTWRRLSDIDELRPFFELVDQADRAAAARVVRPTMPETPVRKGVAAAYASPDADDDDVLSGRPRPSAGRMSAAQGRARHSGLDTEASANIADVGFDTGMEDSLMFRPRRTGPRALAGVLILGLAGIAAYVGYTRTGSSRSSESADVAAAPAPPPTPPPSPAPAAPAAAPTAAAPPAVPAPPATPPPAAPAAAPPPPSAPAAAATAPAPPPPATKPVPNEAAPADEPAPRAGRGTTESSRPSPEPAPRARSYEQLVAEGDRALERGNTAKAQRAFDEALRLQPDGVGAVTGSGYVLLDRERPLAAIGMFKRALTNAPAFPQALFGLGEAYRAQGNPYQAIEAYKRYLGAAPGGADAPAARRQLRELESQAAPPKHSATSPAPEPIPAPAPPAN